MSSTLDIGDMKWIPKEIWDNILQIIDQNESEIEKYVDTNNVSYYQATQIFLQKAYPELSFHEIQTLQEKYTQEKEHDNHISEVPTLVHITKNTVDILQEVPWKKHIQNLQETYLQYCEKNTIKSDVQNEEISKIIIYEFNDRLGNTCEISFWWAYELLYTKNPKDREAYFRRKYLCISIPEDIL